MGRVPAVVSRLPLDYISRLEVQREPRARPLDRGRVVLRDGVRRGGRRLPLELLPVRRLGDDGHLVGDEEGGVEAHPELPDQVGRVPPRPERLCKLFRARLRDPAEVLAHILAREADAIVLDSERVGLLVRHHADTPLVRRPAVLRQREEPLLVAGVGGVADELAKEDILVRVERVDDNVHHLGNLGLELERLAAVLSHSGVRHQHRRRPPRRPHVERPAVAVRG